MPRVSKLTIEKLVEIKRRFDGGQSLASMHNAYGYSSAETFFVALKNKGVKIEHKMILPHFK